MSQILGYTRENKIRFPKGSLLVVLDEKSLSVKQGNTFVSVASGSFVVTVDDVEEEEINNVWQYIGVITQFGFADVASWQLRERAEVVKLDV